MTKLPGEGFEVISKTEAQEAELHKDIIMANEEEPVQQQPASQPFSQRARSEESDNDEESNRSLGSPQQAEAND